MAPEAGELTAGDAAERKEWRGLGPRHRVQVVFKSGESITLTITKPEDAAKVAAGLMSAMRERGAIADLTDDAGRLALVRADEIAAVVLPR